MSLNLSENICPTKYPKLRRFPVGKMPVGKEDAIMPMEDAKDVFRQHVIIEEKMDGKDAVIDADRFRLFMNDMKITHTICYRIPARFVVFDIFDKHRTVFLSREEKESVFGSIQKNVIKLENFNSYHFFLAPLISSGMYTFEDLPGFIGLSKYAINRDTKAQGYMEGVVVKPDHDTFLFELEHLSGKLVREEFTKGITANYLEKPIRFNLINPSFEV